MTYSSIQNSNGFSVIDETGKIILGIKLRFEYLPGEETPYIFYDVFDPSGAYLSTYTNANTPGYISAYGTNGSNSNIYSFEQIKKTIAASFDAKAKDKFAAVEKIMNDTGLPYHLALGLYVEPTYKDNVYITPTPPPVYNPAPTPPPVAGYPMDSFPIDNTPVIDDAPVYDPAPTPPPVAGYPMDSFPIDNTPVIDDAPLVYIRPTNEEDMREVDNNYNDYSINSDPGFIDLNPIDNLPTFEPIYSDPAPPVADYPIATAPPVVTTAPTTTNAQIISGVDNKTLLIGAGILFLLLVSK